MVSVNFEAKNDETWKTEEWMLEYGLDYYSDSEYEPGIRYSRSIKKTMK